MRWLFWDSFNSQRSEKKSSEKWEQKFDECTEAAWERAETLRTWVQQQFDWVQTNSFEKEQSWFALKWEQFESERDRERAEGGKHYQIYTSNE